MDRTLHHFAAGLGVPSATLRRAKRACQQQSQAPNLCGLELLVVASAAIQIHVNSSGLNQTTGVSTHSRRMQHRMVQGL